MRNLHIAGEIFNGQTKIHKKNSYWTQITPPFIVQLGCVLTGFTFSLS